MPKLVKTFSLSLPLHLFLSISVSLCLCQTHTHTHTHTHTQFVCSFAILNLPVVTISFHAGKHWPFSPLLLKTPTHPPLQLKWPRSVNLFFFSLSIHWCVHSTHASLALAQLEHWPENISTLVLPLTCLMNLTKCLISVCLGNLIPKLGKIIVAIHKTAAMD